ncbi:MAG TPA: hypothetical protein VHM24_10305, partial [Gemmatimonadaceae bacterium]|nr:hypothetical protein [Gemmatimonadaceae bacterium]
AGGSPRGDEERPVARPRPPQTASRPTRAAELPPEPVRAPPTPPRRVTPFADQPPANAEPAQKTGEAPDWRAALDDSAGPQNRARLTSEAVREERLARLRAQDPVLDAAVRELDLDLLD